MHQNVAASTQNQGLAALLFLYQHALEQPLNRMVGVVRARRPKRLPVVLTGEEVEVVLTGLEGQPLLVCILLYGSGLRLQEGLQLRVNDLEFGRVEILVREGKGQKDRVTCCRRRCMSRSSSTCGASAGSTRAICGPAWGRRPCPMRWPGSIPTPPASGAGSGSSQLPLTMWIPGREYGIAITCRSR